MFQSRIFGVSGKIQRGETKVSHNILLVLFFSRKGLYIALGGDVKNAAGCDPQGGDDWKRHETQRHKRVDIRIHTQGVGL